MRIYDKDNNYLTRLSTGMGLQLRIGSLLDIHGTIYIVKNMTIDNTNDQHITYVDTLLNHRLRSNILEFNQGYYRPEEIQVYLNNIGLDITLKDDIDSSKDTEIIKV